MERVDGLTPKADWTRAYGEINAFERMLTDDGVRIVKLFLDIDKKEQLRRFRERAIVPYKRWKLGVSDLRAHEQWKNYQRAYKDMIGSVGRLPLAGTQSLDLDHYVTTKALDGLFLMVGEEEKEIRTNPAARTTDLLKTVFGR